MLRTMMLLPALTLALCAQGLDYIRANYTKYEYLIPMRDGVRLFTSVYIPKDASQSYPIMLNRTPYSVGPYGEDQYRASLGPSEAFARDGFIFALQDVRGRYMSEGTFVEVRPQNAAKRSPRDIDESTDTWDTIDWLVKHVRNNNGKVGMWGVSYPGFYVAAGMIDAHPALQAASPQAPIGDYFLGDDSFHNGAFMLAANFGFYRFFVERKGGPSPADRESGVEFGTPDGYEFYLNMGPLAQSTVKYFKEPNPYWNMNLEHTTYDEFWQARAVVRHLRNVTPAVMTVGGWFDAEDLSGPLHVFRVVERLGTAASNMLVMGPWSHGGWSRGDGQKLGNLDFASKTAEFYRGQIEFPFFLFHLKGKGEPKLPKAYVFETGANQWRKFDVWPPAEAARRTLYFSAGGKLSAAAPKDDGFDEYISDPNRPVPYLGYVNMGMRSDYMTEDQRFASQRPDVLVYQTEPLEHDLTLTGPVHASLHVSTTGTDSDFVVKLIDVYPGDLPDPEQPRTGPPLPANAVHMGGYQQLVRGEPFRGKFRRNFETPEPFVPGQPAAIEFDLPDICHTFRRGHRVMVQVQSSWFPLVDRNPQKFTEIPYAKEEDFQKAVQRIYRGRALSSAISFRAMPETH